MKYLERHPMIMIIVGIFGISLSSIFVRYSQAPSPVTAAWRLLWTVIFLTPVVLGTGDIRRELRSVSPKNLLLSVVSGLFLAIHFVLWFESLAMTSVASSTAIVCTEVIWVAIGFCLFLGGRLSRKTAAAIAAALAGSFLIALADSGSGDQLIGDILSLLSAIAVAVYMLIGREVRKILSTTVYTYIVYAACAAALVITCVTQDMPLLAYGPSAVIVGILLAVFSTILGHSIFSWCLKYFSPAFVSASKLCEPVVAAIMAAFLFGEIPAALQIFGSFLILGGVYFYSRVERESD